MKASLADNKKRKDFLLDILCDIAGSILYAVGIYTFAKTANFAPGGISGLALIMNHLWGLPIGTMSLVLNIPLILLSYKIVGRSFMLKSLRTMLFCTFFLDIVFPFTPTYTGSPFMAALYSGFFIGAALAIFYSRGTSSGGTDFLTITIKVLRPHLSIGMVTMAIDLFIIALGGPVFRNVDAILYGLLTTFITSMTIDKIMFGMASGALAIIITDKGQAIADRIRYHRQYRASGPDRRDHRPRFDLDPRHGHLYEAGPRRTSVRLLRRTVSYGDPDSS